jgi:MFS family permease
MISPMVTYRQLFRIREFRFLYGAQALSYLGDQLAAISVAVLVYDRTGSGFMAAVAYASGWLPGALGGPLLAAYADRFPRRRVMMVCDSARALLVLALITPGLPVGFLIMLLYVMHLFGGPFSAARSALMPDVLEGDAYIAGNGLGNSTFQLMQVIGFLVGGSAVAVAGVGSLLLFDAATFAASALLVRIGVAQRPTAAGDDGRRWLLRDSRAGLRYVFSDPWLRGCLLLVWAAAAFAYAPEAIVYPYARELGGGPPLAGVVLALPCFGYMIGALVLTRVLRTEVRDRLLVPMAVLSTAALIPALLSPPLPVVLTLFTMMGLGAAFAAPVNAVFARQEAPAYRARAMGVAISGLMAVQGLGFLITGMLLDAGLRAPIVAGLSGLLGTATVAALGLIWRRSAAAPKQETGLTRDRPSDTRYCRLFASGFPVH